MTATDELRELLDERGIEHYDHENGEPPRTMPPSGFCSEAEHKEIEMKMEEA